jgi:phosphoribosylformylglycinamidine synthase
MVAMGGGLGLSVDLRKIPADGVKRDDTILFSESAGRFIVTVDPRHRVEFEAGFHAHPCACVGTVTAEPIVKVDGLHAEALMSVSVSDLRAAWKMPFGDLI